MAPTNRITDKGIALTMDRDLQREILQMLSSTYPNPRDVRDFCDANEGAAREMTYLAEHGLVTTQKPRALEETRPIATARLTARGRDFLQGDGGLSAILGVVTIKIHDDTIKHLIADRIQALDLPAPEKKRWLDQLRSLPADATRHLVLKLMEKGLDHGPIAVQWLESYLTTKG